MDHDYCVQIGLPEKQELSTGLVYLKEIFVNEFSTEGDENLDLSIGGNHKLNRHDNLDGLPEDYEEFLTEAENLAKRAKGDETEFSDTDNDFDLPEEINFIGEDLRLYQSTLAVLKNARLHLLSRRNETDGYQLWEETATSCFRKVLASIRWDNQMVSALHKQLVGRLPVEFLSLYFIILRRLQNMVPTSTRRILADEQNESLLNFINSPEVKKTVHSEIADTMIISPLAKSCLFLIVPPLRSLRSGSTSKRFLSFCSEHLATLGDCMEMSFAPTDDNLKLEEFYEEAAESLADKLEELKLEYNEKLLILVGCGSGAALCVKTSQVSSVSLVVSFSFPQVTIAGIRGDVDDDFLTLRTPSLFVVGQLATNCFIDDLKDTLAVLTAPAGLIILGNTDEKLITERNKLILSHISQDTVDFCLLKSIAEYINFILNPPPPPDPNVRVYSRPQVARRTSKKAERLKEIIAIVSSSEDEQKPPPRVPIITEVFALEAPPKVENTEEEPPIPVKVAKLDEVREVPIVPAGPLERSTSLLTSATIDPNPKKLTGSKAPNHRYSMALETASKIVAATKMSGVSVNTVIDIT